MWYQQGKGGMQIGVKVKRGAKESKVVGAQGDFLKVKIAVQPEKGKANEELIKILSKYFKVPRDDVTIVRGKRQERKLIYIAVDKDKLIEAVE